MAALGSEDWCNPSQGGVFSDGRPSVPVCTCYVKTRWDPDASTCCERGLYFKKYPPFLLNAHTRLSLPLRSRNLPASSCQVRANGAVHSRLAQQRERCALCFDAFCVLNVSSQKKSLRQKFSRRCSQSSWNTGYSALAAGRYVNSAIAKYRTVGSRWCPITIVCCREGGRASG